MFRALANIGFEWKRLFASPHMLNQITKPLCPAHRRSRRRLCKFPWVNFFYQLGQDRGNLIEIPNVMLISYKINCCCFGR